MKSNRALATLLGIGILWYSTSCVSTSTTKVIMREKIVSAEELLILQLLSSIIYLNIFGYVGIINLSMRMSEIKILKLPYLYITLAYVSGFLLLQWGLQMVSVSFAVTCRGFEPVITCFLSLVFLKENIAIVQWLAVGIIVIGVSFCAGSDKSWTLPGLIVLFFCDVCFSSRSLFVKFLHQKAMARDIPKILGEKIYYVTCVFGTIILLSLYIMKNLYSNYGSVSYAKILFRIYQLKNHLPILAINSACFTLYNASSYIMLSKIKMSYHAILNSVRQVVVISFSVVFFGTALSMSNIFGIILVSVGVATYSISRRAK